MVDVTREIAPDPRRPSRAQLGVLPLWNVGAAETAGEFAKLSKPYSDAKPGKIACALQYKLSLTR